MDTEPPIEVVPDVLVANLKPIMLLEEFLTKVLYLTAMVRLVRADVHERAGRSAVLGVGVQLLAGLARVGGIGFQLARNFHLALDRAVLLQLTDAVGPVNDLPLAGSC
jgi:hypothetical protein